MKIPGLFQQFFFFCHPFIAASFKKLTWQMVSFLIYVPLESEGKRGRHGHGLTGLLLRNIMATIRPAS
jgi:hypothetical protein